MYLQISPRIARFLTPPYSFDPDDLRKRKILNILLVIIMSLAVISAVSVFSYGDSIEATLGDSNAQRVLAASVGLFLGPAFLFVLNRFSRTPKGVIGWIFVIGVIALIAVADTPQELTRRSVSSWVVPVILSTIVLPPASVFVVDLLITLVFIYSSAWPHGNVYGLIEIYGISFLAWLGMSIADHAIRDARNEAEKNSAILNGVADGVVVLGPDNNVVLANPMALEMMDGQIAELASLGQDMNEFGGRLLSFHWSEVRGVGRVAIVRDITRAREVEHAKDAILGVVSHEMRTPLTSIMGFSELLMAMTDGKVADMVKKIFNNADRLMTLVDDVLDHAQIEAGTLKMQKDAFATARLAATVEETFSRQAIGKNITLNVEVASSMPEVVIGDFQRLQQVAFNLVENAIKFTNEGGNVDVSFSVDGQPNQWQIIVKDNGIGIPPGRMPDIFEAFRRGSDYATRRHQGAGLGLSIARKIAKFSGGDITAKSALGEGSTFTVTIPMNGEVS